MSNYTPEQRRDLLESLIEYLSDGIPLRQFARDHCVSYGRLYAWIKDDEEAGGDISKRIARAREAGYEAIAEECLEIVDGPGDAQDKKVRVWLRLQLLSKWHRQRYGEQQRIDHAGVSDQPITIITGVPQPKAKDEDETAFG